VKPSRKFSKVSSSASPAGTVSTPLGIAALANSAAEVSVSAAARPRLSRAIETGLTP
jgi:hypothetical protein